MITTLPEDETLLTFLITGLGSESYEAQTVCADALHSWGEDALSFLREAATKDRFCMVRRPIRAVIRRISSTAPRIDVSVQDAILVCLATDDTEGFSDLIASAAKHLGNLVDDILSLAVDLRSHPARCIRALHVAWSTDEVPCDHEMRRLKKLAAVSRSPQVRMKANELLVFWRKPDECMN